MRPHIVLGIARSEARLARRLVRFWVFGAISILAVLVLYLYYAFLHGLFSSYSASVGAISPRFLIAAFGIWGILLFLVGIIVLGFDVRSRDERERILEVLDSRPYSNLELVAGRFLGLLTMSWLTMVAAILLIEVIGLLGSALGWRVGEPLEPRSILAFVFHMTVPSFALVLALTFLISLLFRNRMATALTILALLGLWFYWFFWMVPVDLAGAYDFTGTYTLNIASEIVSIFTPRSHLQRASVLVLALGILGLAAALHPRPDTGRRKVWAAVGAVLVALGLAGIGSIVKQVDDARATAAAWRAAHEARRGEPEPDLETIRGLVTIEPGRSVDLDLELDLRAPPDAALERALLTLNPGLAVTRVADGTGRELAFTHENGLLDVVLPEPLAAGSSTTLALSAGGAIDPSFGYLDAALKYSDMNLFGGNGNLGILGYFPALLDPNLVALMPGVRWLPAAGVDVGRDDPDRRTEFFHLDLTVDLPEGWLVAGPGRRRPVDAAAGRVRFRFAPEAPLPEAALVASRYVSRSIEVAGVELEILLDPRHTRNLEVLADASGEIRSWLEERFREAAEEGLAYPYGALTMVEVPPNLQGFGGGWRMDTVLAPPAMLLMRESSFPTARFDSRFRDPKEFEDQEGGIARAERKALETFFENDFLGGNVFLGAARNFFLYQTAAQGTGALALDFVCDDLANRIVTGKRGYFSAHIFRSAGDNNQLIGSAFATFFGGGAKTFVEAFESVLTERPEVWEQVLGVSLADMDPWKDPGRSVNVLVLKGGAMSRSLADGLGRDKAAALLAALRARATGRTFNRAEFSAVAAELGLDLDALVGDWLDETDLPGFVASEPRLYRLPDAGDGSPRYQVALDLRNDEPAPGLLRLRYTVAGQNGSTSGGSSGGGGGGGNNRNRRDWQESEPVMVGGDKAVEIGMVLSKPPNELRVAPYLALNRTDFSVALPALQEEKIVAAEPFAGVRESDWSGADGGAIVVDDLDAGFAVESDQKRQGLRLGARQKKEQTLDQGLPVALPFQVPSDWSRRDLSDAWGKYRHTLALVRKGTGTKRAVFTAELPRPGRWRLELHMIPAGALRWKQGTYHLTVEDPSGSHQLTFDAGAAEEGWNALGELEVDSGEVRVAISDQTDGRVVTADAIRWQPAVSARVEEKTDG